MTRFKTTDDHSKPITPEMQVDGVYRLVWNEEMIRLHGPIGKFMVEMQNGYQTAPISIEKAVDGTHEAYNFTLDGNQAIIHFL